MARPVITYYDYEQGSPEWLTEREGQYTGSNAYKLLGTVGYRENAKAADSGFKGNFHTERGHMLEPKAIALYEKIKDVTVNHTGFIKNSLFPGCLYSPDGFTDDTLIEVKCFSKKKHLEIYNAKSALEIDIKITAQIHYGMLITGRKIAHLVIYNPHFAKRQIMGEYEELVDNPDYDPIKAFKIIPIRRDPAIANNFKRKLDHEPLHTA